MAYAATPPASLRSGAGRQPQLEAKRGLAIVVLGDAHGEPLIRERLVSEGHEGYDDLADRLGAPEEVLCARARARDERRAAPRSIDGGRDSRRAAAAAARALTFVRDDAAQLAHPRVGDAELAAPLPHGLEVARALARGGRAVRRAW